MSDELRNDDPPQMESPVYDPEEEGYNDGLNGLSPTPPPQKTWHTLHDIYMSAYKEGRTDREVK